MGLNLFKLEKLLIEAFTDVERNSPASPKEMEVMFNPTTFKRRHAIKYSRTQALNSSNSPSDFVYTPPGEISFQLVLDGTGAAFFGVEHLARLLRQKSVKDDIKTFEKVCLNMNGKIHEPNFLNISWGDHLDFPGRLKTLDITYKLFDEGGDPLRADLDVVFVEDKAADTIALEAHKSSPDLTHLRVAKSGDTLPLLCKEIYGSSRYYLQAAADNGLDDFRNLVPGQKLRFPPLT